MGQKRSEDVGHGVRYVRVIGVILIAGIVDITLDRGTILPDKNRLRMDMAGRGFPRFMRRDECPHQQSRCLPYRSHQSHSATARKSGIPTPDMKFIITGVPPASPFPPRSQALNLRGILEGSNPDLGPCCWPHSGQGHVLVGVRQAGRLQVASPSQGTDPESGFGNIRLRRQPDAEPTLEQLEQAADLC